MKIPLYINSRYLDVLGKWNVDHSEKPLECWVVTNTKFSTDAVQYGNCVGLHLLGWNYPFDKSLSILVDHSGLYPVTCLSTLSNKEKELILQAGIVLCSDLKNNPGLLKTAGISLTRIPKVLAEAAALCPAE